MERLGESKCGVALPVTLHRLSEARERRAGRSLECQGHKNETTMHLLRELESGFFCCTLELCMDFLSLDRVCIRSPMDEQNVPARCLNGIFFFSVDLVNLLINGFDTDRII